VGVITWNESYRVGDEKIDAQHCYLFAAAEELVQTSGREALTVCMMRLFRYVRQHFRHEEEVMRQSGYPGWEAHVLMHDDLIERLSVLSRAIHDDRWTPAGIEDFMNTWLVGHILHEDRKLARYLATSEDTCLPFGLQATRL
jgi:hemerythrin